MAERGGPADAASTPAGGPPAASRSWLVGREAVLVTADRLIGDARAGGGQVLLVAGEAGMGKTTVAREIARRAAAAGMVSRWGAAFDGASLLPFGVWMDCLRHPDEGPCAEAAAGLDGVDSELEGDAAGAQRQRLRRFGVVVDALRRASATEPQAMVLEDLHWADAGSLELLAAVAAAVPALGVLVVATYRPEELDADGPLAALGGGVDRIVLEGLTEEESARLLADSLGRQPSAIEIDRVHRQTGGNPLFLTQVARLSAGAGAGGVPTPLRDVLARRLARVSSRCDHVLGAAATIGFDFDVDTLVEVLDEPRAEVVEVLEEAAAARLAVADAAGRDRWQFLHDLVRLARYEALGTEQRERWHGRIVDVLSRATDVPAGVLANHAALAGLDRGDPRPAQCHLAAAREALRRMAWTEAVTLGDRARRAAPPGDAGDELRAEAWLAQGEAHLRAGDHDRAADAFAEVSELGRRLGSPEVVARAALGFGAGLGGFEVRLFDQRQIDLLEEAAAALAEDASLRPLVLARLSVALSMRSFDDRRLALADEAVELARRLDDGRVLAAALAARCDAMAGPDHVAERLAAAGEIITLARQAVDRSLELLGRRLRVVALLEQRDLAVFDAEIEAYDRAAAALGDPFYGWYADLWRAMRAHADGRLDEAERLAERAGTAGATAGSRNATLLRRVLMLFLHLDRGDRDRAHEQWRAVVGDEPDVNEFATFIWALIDSRSGHLDEARIAVGRLGPELLDMLPKDQEWLPNVAQAVVTAARVGNRDVARRAYELLLPYAGLGVFEGLAAVDYGVVDRFLALAAGCCGDVDAALRHTEQAMASTPGAGRLVIAGTRADGARALVASADPVARRRGAELARQARAELEKMGLDWLAAEAGQLLAASGRGGSEGTEGEGTEGSVGAEGSAWLVREGDTWAFTFDGSTARASHAKGIADLAVLLSRGGEEVHVRDLTGVAGSVPAVSTQAALDDRAVREYRERLHDLEAELDEADRNADLERSAALAAERDALLEELRRGFGLAGRRRSAGSDPDERMRKAVSARVKAAIDRLESLHPALGRHLRASVRTGYWCSYQPERPTDWTVVTQP